MGRGAVEQGERPGLALIGGGHVEDHAPAGMQAGRLRLRRVRPALGAVRLGGEVAAQFNGIDRPQEYMLVGDDRPARRDGQERHDELAQQDEEQPASRGG